MDSMKEIAACILILMFSVAGQAQIIEVASVRRHAPHDACSAAQVLPGGTVKVGCVSLEMLLRDSLDVLPPRQIGGLTGWMKDDEWDIVAKTTGWELLKEEEIYRKALWEIAQERFHVEVRSEKRDVRGFALTVGKSGKLGPDIRPTAGGAHTFKVQAHSTLVANNVGMAELAKWLMVPAASPGDKKDETSLSGRYDFTLRWCPLRAEQVKDPTVLESPIIFDALREQLGLRLKAAKVPQDFYTVVHAQSPDAN